MSEDIFIPMIIFSFILALVWMILSFLKWRYQQKQEAEGGSLRTSELQALMREAVAEANAPLLGRIHDLEAALRRERAAGLLPASEDRLLEDASGDPEKEAAPATRRRVT